MAILMWIVIGLIAGFITVASMPGRDPGGGIITVLLGLIGSIGGGYIGRAASNYGKVADTGGEIGQPGFLIGLVTAVVGVALVMAIYRFVVSKKIAT